MRATIPPPGAGKVSAGGTAWFKAGLMVDPKRMNAAITNLTNLTAANVKTRKATQAMTNALLGLIGSMHAKHRLFLDRACDYHAPTLWLLGEYHLVDECLTCWVEAQLH